MSSNQLISIVSPVYMAQNIVDELVKRMEENIIKISNSYEIILVEDGSPDNSWLKIEEVCKRNKNVKGIKLSRNFGQHYAITAGLQESKGNFVIVMDCDLQDNPKYIPDLYNKVIDGNDIVFTSKKIREHSFFKNLTAKIFFQIFNYLSENQSATADVGAYSILSRKAVDAFCKINDAHRHYLLILRILGFKSAHLEIEHEKRFEGKSSYSFSKLVKHAINGIASQSDKLLRLSIGVGLFVFVAAFVWACILVSLYFVRGAFPGYTSLMVMLLLSTGMILMSIGIVGIYIGKIFDQTKNRPLYFIDKKLNF